MNNDTSKTSRAAAPLDVKPDLVKRIGNTTFDIHIHFSETSRETFTDKVVRLIENDKDSVTNWKEDTLFLVPYLTLPKGDIVIDTGNLLRRNGYRIKILNTINFRKSMKYNPFSYIHSEKDILKLVTTLISNTKGEGKGGDEFWTKAETLLYCALIGYIYYEAPKEEQNFSTLIEFINAMEVREDDEEFKNPVDLMFDELAERDPNHFAVRQYAKYRLAAGDICSKRLVNSLIFRWYARTA